MNYNKAMQRDDKDKWKEAVKEEFDRFRELNVFKTVPISEVPHGTKVLTTTWAMKKKANGKYRARLNMRGFEQANGQHYDDAWTSAPVASDVTIRILLVLMLMCGWSAHVVDVRSAFLLAKFENNERLYFFLHKVGPYSCLYQSIFLCCDQSMASNKRPTVFIRC
jgi:hypothetical protein